MNNIDLDLKDSFLRMDLKAIRKSKGLSQKELSELSGLSVDTICNMENGDRSFTIKSLLKYLNALGYDIFIKKENRGDTDD